MDRHEVIVVGGGISGIAFAWKAAARGRRVLLLDREHRLGGCIHSHRRDDGFWFEMGAHTTYNSYGGFLEIAQGSGAAASLVPRGPARARFGLLHRGSYSWLSPPRLLLKFNWLEIALRAPVGVFRGKEGRTMSEYYGGLLGRGNYRKFLRPFLAAVPSQSADGFPAAGAGSLFKKRPRREGFPRSFGFGGGLQTVCERAAGSPDITVRTGAEVTGLLPGGDGFSLRLADGTSLSAPVVALAAPSHVAVSLLAEGFGALAQALSAVEVVGVESVGVVLPRERCWMPEAAFLVPTDDIFWSTVTRDPFPDARLRAFAFHFKPGHSKERKLARMAEVLRVEPAELEGAVEQSLRIPSPALGHGAVVSAIDRHLAGTRLALTGNYFQGLAIEDCVQRSFQECRRVFS